MDADEHKSHIKYDLKAVNAGHLVDSKKSKVIYLLKDA